MLVLALYAVLVATPLLVLLAAGRALELWCGSYRTPRRPERAAGRDIGRLAADLRRLEAEHRRIARSDLPARVVRLRGVAMAYDDTLLACCGAVGLASPAPPLSALDRLLTEAALAQQGVQW